MILITGGSGVVGSRVAQGLLDSQQQVRILTRGGSDWADNPLPHFRRAGVEIITGDMRDPNKLAAALSGVRGIVHLAAVMRGTDKEMESVNVEGLLNLVALAATNNIQRFIHVSCLGATQFSTSKYFQTKWQGETMIRTSNFYWTIFRPSLIFAPTSHLMRALDYAVNRAPFIPVMGSGLNMIQPISADDVAACVVQSLYNRDTVGQTYDLVGPKAYSLTELLEMSGHAASTSSTTKTTVKVPLQLGFLLANLVSKMNPRAPISEDLVRVITTELIGDHTPMRTTFQVPFVSYESQFKRLAAPR
jgi:NADH dehydrogenase